MLPPGASPTGRGSEQKQVILPPLSHPDAPKTLGSPTDQSAEKPRSIIPSIKSVSPHVRSVFPEANFPPAKASAAEPPVESQSYDTSPQSPQTKPPAEKTATEPTTLSKSAVVFTRPSEESTPDSGTDEANTETPEGDSAQRRYLPGERRNALLAVAEHLPEGTDAASALDRRAAIVRDAVPLLLDPTKSNKEISQALTNMAGRHVSEQDVSRMNRTLTNALLKEYPELAQHLPPPTGREIGTQDPNAVGQRFSRLREQAGIGQEVVAERLEWSKPKMSKFVNGHIHLSTTDLKAALDEIGVTDPEIRQELIALNRAAREAADKRLGPKPQ